MKGGTPQDAMAAAVHASSHPARSGTLTPLPNASLSSQCSPSSHTTPHRAHGPLPKLSSLSPIQGRQSQMRTDARDEADTSGERGDNEGGRGMATRDNREPVDFQPCTLDTWRDDSCNPKSTTYKYWQLGSLGPMEKPETAAKRDAIARARRYGTTAARASTMSSAPKAPPVATRARACGPAKAASSKTQRAKDFARTIKPPAAGDARPRPADRRPTAAARLPAPKPPSNVSCAPRRTVSSLLARHESAARSIEQLRQDVAQWPEEPPTPPQATARTRNRQVPKRGPTVAKGRTVVRPVASALTGEEGGAAGVARVASAEGERSDVATAQGATPSEAQEEGPSGAGEAMLPDAVATVSGAPVATVSDAPVATGSGAPVTTGSGVPVATCSE
jgi:hypothetical protein